MQDRIKRNLLVIALIALAVPFIQQCLPFVSEDGLFGFFDIANDVPFSFDKWIDGSYQQKKETFLNDRFGFRPALVRLKDQVAYSLFTKANYGGALIGKHDDFFYNDYIRAYNGTDYTGDSFICAKLVKLKALQDTFSHLGKTIVLCYAPNKAFFAPEDLPDNVRMHVGHTNYESYLRIGDSIGISSINFNQWFLGMKDTGKELLFTKAGTHWSVYGSVLAGDSLVRYIEKARHIHLPHPEWVKVDHVRTPRMTDADIEETMNLMWSVTDQVYAYPILKYPEDTTKKPKIILIGDSFAVNLLRNGFPQHTFDSDWQYWFVFHFLDNKDTPIGGTELNPLIKDYDWKSALDKTDCLVLMYTSINLCAGRCELGSGFIEQAYDHYFPAMRYTSLVQ